MNGEEGRRKLSPAQVALCIAIQLHIGRPNDFISEEDASVLGQLLVLLLQPNERGHGSGGSAAINTGSACSFTELMAVLQASSRCASSRRMIAWEICVNLKALMRFSPGDGTIWLAVVGAKNVCTPHNLQRAHRTICCTDRNLVEAHIIPLLHI